MKFSEAWAEVIRQNQHLKIALLGSVMTTMVLAICTIHFSTKEPLVFERACFTKEISNSSLEPTALEYENFLNKALRQRFNSDENIIEGYLSVEEKKNKLKEQENLAKNGILQFFLHRKIEVKDDYFLINGDRLYSVNNVRSAMPIVLKVTVESKDRTETNPYGLILVKTEVLKEDDGKKEKGGVRANR